MLCHAKVIQKIIALMILSELWFVDCVVCCAVDPFRETESALRHLSSVHAASTRRANEIQQSSAKVNEDAASQLRRSEYLSAVHCADSAAAIALLPVRGLRDAIELTNCACGEAHA